MADVDAEAVSPLESFTSQAASEVKRQVMMQALTQRGSATKGLVQVKDGACVRAPASGHAFCP